MPLKVYTPPSTKPLTLPYWVLAIADRGVAQFPGSWWAAVLMLSEAWAGSARMPRPAVAESSNASRRLNRLPVRDLLIIATPLLNFLRPSRFSSARGSMVWRRGCPEHVLGCHVFRHTDDHEFQRAPACACEGLAF